jgi:hypothetical protein
MGLRLVPDEQYLYVHLDKLIFIFFYVDDILIISHSTVRQEIKDILKKL